MRSGIRIRVDLYTDTPDKTINLESVILYCHVLRWQQIQSSC